MTIYIGSDHAGFKLKEEIKEVLSSMNIKFDDMTPAFNEHDDYPDSALMVSEKVIETEEKGILICGTGNGMSIAANKVPGIRAALCKTRQDAEYCTEHNNANILILQGWFTNKEQAKEMIEGWLKTTYEDGRHDIRLNKIEDIEKKYSKS